MSVALYRKYRSKSLDEIVGQSHVTDVLRRALDSGKIAHAYLFTGPRGTGKTSIARIMAHEINKLPYTDDSEHLDIIEIDAASNNGVDDVRNLREKALITPASAEHKIYIIDEVHMLSKPAFNALLKILEEPPEHVVFILATTDFDKLPDTIVSRTQRFNFHLVDLPTVQAHLAHIAQQENIDITPEALMLISQRGGGSLRDSISLLDQLQHTSSSVITPEIIQQTLGLASDTQVAELVKSVLAGDASAVLIQLQTLRTQGVSAVTLASQLRGTLLEQLTSAPWLIQTIDHVSEVPYSRHPDIKLAVALLANCATRLPQPVAATPVTVAQPVATQPPAPAATPAPKPTAAPSTPAPETPAPVTKTTTPTPKPAQPAAATSTQSIVLESFDWQKIIDYANEHSEEFKGVQTLLLKCKAEVATGGITIYAGNRFNATKLDTAKNRAVIGKIFTETGVGNPEVSILGTPPPPKDSQAAKIAAMMGGGEEVDVS